jgi:hypothetical protein
MARFLFTSESVTEGHPDKICDQISDAVLDDIYAHDPQARVACETTVTTGQILVMGEISSTHKPDVAKIARKVVCDIGYDDGAKGFDGNACEPNFECYYIIIRLCFPQKSFASVFAFENRNGFAVWKNLCNGTSLTLPSGAFGLGDHSHQPRGKGIFLGGGVGAFLGSAGVFACV